MTNSRLTSRALNGLWLPCVALLAVACGPSNPSPDASNNNDGSMSMPDASGDAQPDAAAQPRVCDMANIVNLSMAGMRTGSTTRYTGTTASAASNAMIAIPANCIGGGMAIRQVAHTYTVQNMGYLRVSTANAGTPSGMGGHDTVVWVQDRCDTRGTMSFGCNDDAEGGLASTVVTNRLVMPGQTVTIIVATLAMAAGGAGLPYELSVEEVAPVMMGGECDPSGANLCATGLTCVGNAQIGRCVPNGSLGAACRTGNMCDAPLECIEVAQNNFRCFNRAPMGGACNSVTLCPDTADCLPDSMMPRATQDGRCRERGAEGGLCGGSTMARCVMGTTCTGTDMQIGTCVRDVMMGAACDPTGISTRCPMGSSCATSMMGYTCQANGSAAGTTCTDAAPRCSGMGLACSTMTGAGVCRSTASMAGAMCDPRFGSITCAGMEACSANGDGAGTCRAAVAEGMADNNSPMTAEAARALPLVIRGSLAASDIDCFNVTLAANSGIVAQVSDGAGGCPAGGDSVLFLIDSMGRTVATNDDSTNLCSYLDTRDNAFTRMLPAGTYSVCVRNYNAMSMFASYVLSVNAAAPRM